MRGLKRLRNLAGLTQSRLSQLVGIDRSVLSLAESGQLALNGSQKQLLRQVLLREIGKRSEAIRGVLSAAGTQSSAVG